LKIIVAITSNTSILDLSDNKIDDPAILDIVKQLSNLKVLYLKGNPVVNKIAGYRKVIISSLPQLTYLDDRPVFEDESRCAAAWCRGGHEEEVHERQKIREEKLARHKEQVRKTNEMIERAKQRKMERERLLLEQKKKEELQNRCHDSVQDHYSYNDDVE
jgi:dynein assembly factor 1